MSIVLPSLPVGKSKSVLAAKLDSGEQTQDWLAQLLASADIHLNGNRAWDICAGLDPLRGANQFGPTTCSLGTYAV